MQLHIPVVTHKSARTAHAWPDEETHSPQGQMVVCQAQVAGHPVMEPTVSLASEAPAVPNHLEQTSFETLDIGNGTNSGRPMEASRRPVRVVETILLGMLTRSFPNYRSVYQQKVPLYIDMFLKIAECSEQIYMKGEEACQALPAAARNDSHIDEFARAVRKICREYQEQLNISSVPSVPRVFAALLEAFRVHRAFLAQTTSNQPASVYSNSWDDAFLTALFKEEMASPSFVRAIYKSFEDDSQGGECSTRTSLSVGDRLESKMQPLVCDEEHAVVRLSEGNRLVSTVQSLVCAKEHEVVKPAGEGVESSAPPSAEKIPSLSPKEASLSNGTTEHKAHGVNQQEGGLVCPCCDNGPPEWPPSILLDWLPARSKEAFPFGSIQTCGS